MLPIRMKKRKMFLHVSEQGIRVVAGSILLQACPNSSQQVRIGFTVTKKLGGAVIRNRIRRRLREVVRLCPIIPCMTGYDLVFIGRQSTPDRPFPKLKADLTYALNEVRRTYQQAAHD